MMDSLATQLTDAAERLQRFPAGIVNRVVGLAIAAPAWVVLGMAGSVTPDPRGFGTHTALGLGKCLMLEVTGYPCPMCGMTTTFALMAHLRPFDALLNQPFGPVLFLITLLGAVSGLVDLVTGVGLWRKLLAIMDRYEQRIAAGLLIGLFGGWVYKVALLHPELLPF